MVVFVVVVGGGGGGGGVGGRLSEVARLEARYGLEAFVALGFVQEGFERGGRLRRARRGRRVAVAVALGERGWRFVADAVRWFHFFGVGGLN